MQADTVQKRLESLPPLSRAGIETKSRQRGVGYAKGEPDAVKAASPVQGGGASQPGGA